MPGERAVPTLRDLQRAVGRTLLRPEDDTAESYVIGDGLAPWERIAIYRNTLTATLLKALALSYPVVRRLVGPAFFDYMGQDFILKHPPRSAYLTDYGPEFSEFLTGFRPVACLSYLPDVARLEWAVNLALHAGDARPLDIQRLAAVRSGNHERIRFVPHPSVSLINATCPADEIWRSVLAEDDLSLAAINLVATPIWLIVQRLSDGVDVARLDRAEWRLLKDLCAGRTLAELYDHTGALPGLDPSAALARHLAAGCFIDFSLAEAKPPARRSRSR
jgi:hypothetical protein